MSKSILNLLGLSSVMSNDFKDRFITGFLLFFGISFCTIKGGVWYLVMILNISLLMMYEMINMLMHIKEKNINYYYSYRKIGFASILVFSVSLLLLRESTQGIRLILWLFGTVWTVDSSAFIFGKKYGKTKLAPKISSNKTIEGAIFGVIGGLFVSMLFYALFKANLKNSFGFNNFMILTLIITIMSQIGDLSESWLKRQCNLKNSGNILPGHGGILDRFDSILIVAPFIYIIVFLNGGILF